MSNTSRMTWDQIHVDDDASSRKRYKPCDSDGGRTWSDLNHDVLSIIMMILGISEFVACSRVCKSWRSLALSDQNKFMVSKPPVDLQMSLRNKKERYIEDFEGRRSKLIIAHLSEMKLIGVTRGYLILFSITALNFCLVNPITRHELHFPCDESAVTKGFRDAYCYKKPRVILVFSPSISGWVLVVLRRDTGEIWYSVVGKGEWNNVSSNFFIVDVIAFKGKIYVLSNNTCPLCELRLYPQPKLTLVETKNFRNLEISLNYTEFVSSVENLLVWVIGKDLVFELDYGQMKWVSIGKRNEEYTFFDSDLNHIVAVKEDSWADSRLRYKHRKDGRASVLGSLRARILCRYIWYFPHECMNIDLIDE